MDVGGWGGCSLGLPSRSCASLARPLARDPPLPPPPPLPGFTTNPTILKRDAVACTLPSLRQLAVEAFAMQAEELQLQAWGRTAADMYACGLDLAELDSRVVVKVSHAATTHWGVLFELLLGAPTPIWVLLLACFACARSWQPCWRAHQRSLDPPPPTHTHTSLAPQVPVTLEGIKAARLLAEDGVPFTLTGGWVGGGVMGVAPGLLVPPTPRALHPSLTPTHPPVTPPTRRLRAAPGGHGTGGGRFVRCTLPGSHERRWQGGERARVCVWGGGACWGGARERVCVCVWGGCLLGRGA